MVSDSGSVSDSALTAPCFCELEGMFVYAGACRQDQCIVCLGQSLLYAIASSASQGVLNDRPESQHSLRLGVVGFSLACCGTHP